MWKENCGEYTLFTIHTKKTNFEVTPTYLKNFELCAEEIFWILSFGTVLSTIHFPPCIKLWNAQEVRLLKKDLEDVDISLTSGKYVGYRYLYSSSKKSKARKLNNMFQVGTLDE